MGLIGDDDDPTDLVGVSTQAGSDLPGESFHAESGLNGDAASEPRLLSEPSAYLGLVFLVLVLRRTFFGVGVELLLLLSIATELSFFVGVILAVCLVLATELSFSSQVKYLCLPGGLIP